MHLAWINYLITLVGLIFLALPFLVYQEKVLQVMLVSLKVLFKRKL